MEGPALNPPVILFDGVCNLCNSAVQWIIRNDPEAKFRLAALHSEAAARVLREAKAPANLPDSIVLIDESGVFTRSTAVLRIARRLGKHRVLVTLSFLVPRVIRDCVYRLIARYRYRWFGKRESCMVPTPEIRSRFLD